jgi:acetyltransferase-like isoleucine patch superfamily enzyme
MIEFIRNAIRNLKQTKNQCINTEIGNNVKIYSPSNILNSKIGDYSYISTNSKIDSVTIGKFCSIGPNFIAGWGIHPTNGLSTHPMFYSVNRQNGISLASKNKISERENIEIGNDVFIGMNVIVLDGVKIGNGAVIGAGAVVSKDIPPYAIAVGNPIRIIKFRFNELEIKRLQEICWWDNEMDGLMEVEKYFFKVSEFIENNN